jgi:D-alanyl-D-alanine carboxypeptidase
VFPDAPAVPIQTGWSDESGSDLCDDGSIRPLHLTGTSLPGTSPRIRGPHPHGYVPDANGGLVDYTTMNPSFLGAAGELISTTTDLNRFFAALLDGRLLPPRLLHTMTTPAIPGARYGLGLFLRQTSCGSPSTATTATPSPTSPGPTPPSTTATRSRSH